MATGSGSAIAEAGILDEQRSFPRTYQFCGASLAFLCGFRSKTTIFFGSLG
jgi:hypothetical protein